MFGRGNAMVSHMSRTSQDAQKRYAEETNAILNSYLGKRFDYRPVDLIVKDGDQATKAYGLRSGRRWMSSEGEEHMAKSM